MIFLALRVSPDDRRHGSSDRLRSEAAWFEGLMEKLNSVEPK